jgi:hypothetical protein
LKQLWAEIASINTEANASSCSGVTNASSSTGDLPPVEEVDLTGGDLMYPSKERTNEEVDLTNLDETEKDGEEMYSTDVEAAEV